jgi:hypothetical protein
MPSLAGLLEVADMAARGSISFGGSVMHLSLKMPSERLPGAIPTYCHMQDGFIPASFLRAAAHELAQHIKNKKVANETGGTDWFSLRDVYRHGWSGLDEPDKARAALRKLQDAHWVREMQNRSSSQGGRTSSLYQVNPAVWQ